MTTATRTFMAISLMALMGLSSNAFAQRDSDRDRDRDRDSGEDRRDGEWGGGREVLIDSTLTLDYDDALYLGEGVLALKEEIAAQHGISPRQLKLSKVKLIAKSEDGFGTASLRVGALETAIKTVKGNALDFPGDDDYSSITLDNPNRRNMSDGPWQIRLSGNIKVEKVKVTFDLDEKKIKVDMAEYYTNGGTLPLKRILDEEGLNPRLFVLKEVKIKAKSRNGLGRARLKVNEDLSSAKKIKGNALDFDIELPRTYDSIEIGNPQGDLVTGGGVWQVILIGEIKVSQIEIRLVKKFDRDERGGGRRD
jgi:hypothetical protein